jgi:hypothetical protein
MAAGTLINLTNFITGIALNETGINISDLKITVEPEFITPVMDNFGHMKGKVVGQPKSTISISGEVSGTTGIMAATAITFTTITNSRAYFSAPTTGALFVKGDVTLSRDAGALAVMTAEFETYTGISSV